ncbi:MAG: hypothetical protein GX861_01870 [Tenericutes bacterium]|jgi:dephospho-CoA kinase|nr:hypothetical protein [Mycoplasmatota bacterium]
MKIVNKNPKIIMISGKARHGKDTVAMIIKDYYEQFNKKVVNLQIANSIKRYAQIISNWDGNEETKPREFLQYLGTSIIREKIDNNFLIKQLIEDIKVYSYFFDIVTISDVRLINEINMIKENYKNNNLFKVIRSNFNNGLSKEQQNHITEIELDNYNSFDQIIYNDSDIATLKNKIYQILKELK